MPTSPAGKPPNSQAGFTYAMVLAAVVVVGIVAEAAHLTTWRQQQAEREAELLFRGAAYQRAIASYVQTHGVYPRALEDLYKDPKSPSRRHLRALYPDPMADDAPVQELQSWSLVRAPDGGIAGVASASRGVPLKQAHFPMGFDHFAAASAYAEWVFEYTPAKK